jgi:hypothetical protein
LHRYAYAANNPVSLTDPSGLMPHLPTAPFGNGGLLSPPQPSAPQYDLTGRADGFRGIVDAANQLSRALSQGAHAPECGPTGVLGDWWQSLQRGTLGPDLLRWGLNEYRTNPLWQRQFTDAELRQLTIDLAKRGEFEITRLLHQIVDEKGLQHWLTGQVDYAVHALRDPHMYPVLAFNLGVGLIATGIGAASLPAIAAVGIGSLVANVAFQTWVESGAGLSFNLEAFRSSLGINSAATVPGLIGGMIGARFGPWGRYIGAAIGSGLSQILTNKLMGRDWDEGLLLNMGLSVGMEGVMAGAEHWARGGTPLQPGDGPGAQRTPSEFPDEYEVVGPEEPRQGGLPTEELALQQKPRRAELPERTLHEQWIRGQLFDEEWNFFRKMAGPEHLNERIALSGSLSETDLGLLRRYDPELRESLPDFRADKWWSELIDEGVGDIDLWHGVRNGEKLTSAKVDYIRERLPDSLQGFKFDAPSHGYNTRRYPRLETFATKGGALVFEPDGTVWRVPAVWQQPGWPQSKNLLNLEQYRAISGDPNLFKLWQTGRYP